MRRMSITSRMAAALAALAVTAACSDRADRPDAASGAERAGDAAADAARDAGGAVREAGRAAGDAVMEGGRAADAAVETMDVKMALAADTRVDASNINVDTDHVTRTVTLKGNVPSAAQKALAEEIARGKATGYMVRNALVVEAP